MFITIHKRLNFLFLLLFLLNSIIRITEK